MNPNLRCVAHLDAGGIVLTSDVRQARILRRLHDRAQMDAGRAAWPSARVMSLDTWMARAWSEAGAEREELPRAMSSFAMRWLWRQTVATDVPGMIDANELGARARASGLLLRSHGGSIEELSRWPLTRDQQAFLAWARAVDTELARRNVFDVGDLVRRLVADAALPRPEAPVLLVGFRQPTRAEQALFDALARAGWPVERLAQMPRGGTASRHQAADPQSEIAVAISWLRERLALRPDGIHGFIVPELSTRRGSLERALEAALQPELELPDAPRERVFDLAGGPALEARPVIAIAMDAIRYASGHGDWTEATRLLRSQYIAAAGSEREARARLDVRLRRDGRSHPSRPAELAREAQRADAPMFGHALDGASARLGGDTRHRAGRWAEAFGECLADWQWPGDVALDSSDWQAARRFGELLRNLAELDAVTPEMTSGQALSHVRELTAAPFQPEGSEPAVFVLDSWTDAGVLFDSLWISGLTATAWPRPVRIDPFLPIEVQRRRGMPRASAEACLAEAREIQAAWQAQSDELVLSWPQNEDDTEVDGSALVPATLPRLAIPRHFPVRAELQHQASSLERLAEDRAPAITSPQVPGGARVLELQSTCPFRAFGELRLHARPLEEPQAGFDRRLRGQILHRALEKFWSALGSQAALLALAPEAVSGRIGQSVDQALAEAAPATTGPRLRALEREWQCRAIDRLLALERLRDPFEVVQTEQEMLGRIGGLELRLRADRVDRAAGLLVVIDYKTGRTRGARWRGARMEAPQLPLYALLHPERPAAIALAETGAAAARFVGVGDEALGIEGLVIPSKFELTEDREKGFDWRAVTERWWAWLDALARDHATGAAAVDPKRAAETCRRCHLATLCRVAPARALEEALEEAASDE